MKPAAPFSDDVRLIFKNWKQNSLLSELEECHDQLLSRRIGKIIYGDPDKLSAMKRANLNSQALRQALLHRAECLIVGVGTTIKTKNIYGLALIARGHVEATAVLAYFCDRIQALIKGNIEFNVYEKNVADAVMGSKHSVFPKANAPMHIMTCLEKGDRYLDQRFGKKMGLLTDLYGWLSEFAHPNFCSNKIAFDLDKNDGSLVFRHHAELQESDFQLAAHLVMSAQVFPELFDDFGEMFEKALVG
jgi:hypothetical protein